MINLFSNNLYPQGFSIHWRFMPELILKHWLQSDDLLILSFLLHLLVGIFLYKRHFPSFPSSLENEYYCGSWIHFLFNVLQAISVIIFLRLKLSQMWPMGTSSNIILYPLDISIFTLFPLFLLPKPLII